MPVINGDCFEVMFTMPEDSVDLILCDPPYGIKYIDNVAMDYKRKRGEEVIAQPITNDGKDDIDWDKFFELSYKVLKDRKMLYFCCRMDMIITIADSIKKSKLRYIHDLIWHKGDMGYGNLNVMGTTHEFVVGLSKGAPEKNRPIEMNGVLKKRTSAFYSGKLSKKEYYGHPTQKPIGLMAYIILNRTDVKDVVLDPFAGVGSTIVAAELLGRDYISIEIDQKYNTLIESRLKDKKHLDMYKRMLEYGLRKVGGGVSFDLNGSQNDQTKII